MAQTNPNKMGEDTHPTTGLLPSPFSLPRADPHTAPGALGRAGGGRRWLHTQVCPLRGFSRGFSAQESCGSKSCSLCLPPSPGAAMAFSRCWILACLVFLFFFFHFFLFISGLASGWLAPKTVIELHSSGS